MKLTGIKDFTKFLVTGGITTALSAGLSILFIDYIGWSAKLYNLVWILPMVYIRFLSLKMVGFNNNEEKNEISKKCS